MRFCIDAPAKINLALNIVGRRNDGYHLLESVIQSISLSDTIELEDNGKSNNGMDILISCNDQGIPCDKRNSTYKAAAAMAQKYGLARKLKIHIDKRIPISSGLGGESTDAAAVLTAMSQIYELGLSEKELSEIGASIGSDVPVCLAGGCNLVGGAGEKVSPLPPLSNNYWMLLVKPDVSISTAEVYKKYSALAPERRSPIGDIDAICKWLNGGSIDIPSPEWFQNSLEAVTAGEFEVVRQIKGELIDMGAVASVMTGHGPTVVGLFASPLQEEGLKSRFDEYWFAIAKSCLMKWNSV